MVKIPSAHEIARTTVIAGLSAVEGWGGPAAEFLNLCWPDPAQARMQGWLRKLDVAVADLQAKLNPKDLADNPVFISTLMQATQAAMRTHQAQKLEALRNVVWNAGLGESLDETMLHIAASTVSELSELHLRVLVFAYKPSVDATYKFGPNLLQVLTENIHVDGIESTNQAYGLFQLLWGELAGRGLVGSYLQNEHFRLDDAGKLAPMVHPPADEIVRLMLAPSSSEGSDCD